MTFLQNGRTNKKNRQSNVWHVGQYVRLSKEDGDKPESDSIQNQQRIISKHIEYMEQQGEQIASVKVYSDDGRPVKVVGGALSKLVKSTALSLRICPALAGTIPNLAN